MPIARARLQHYPGGSIRSVAWRFIRATVLFRAGNRCEGTPQRPNCRAENGVPHPDTGSIVVLTVAHMDQAVADHSPENLRALCQLCHNRWDQIARRRSAVATRARKTAAGTGDLFGWRELPLDMDRPDSRRLASAILAAGGDATERTFTGGSGT